MQANDLEPLIARMKRHNFYGDYLNYKPCIIPNGLNLLYNSTISSFLPRRPGSC